jgi:membrane-bound lytic murein transglycosylase B
MQQTLKKYSALLIASIFIVISPLLLAENKQVMSELPEAQAFIQEMVKQHGFEKKSLEKIFQQVSIDPNIIQAMQRPYEAKPWYIYKKNFLTEQRIKQGVQFWKDHRDTLAKVEKQYGVPAEVIVSILGVETFYGRIMGKHRVVEALGTLAFAYPKRAKFFRKELKEFLLLSREQKIDPLSFQGSYAGAFGQAQFMPSSYRAYAASFAQRGPIDIISNTQDAISSVANYLKENGWETSDTLITIPAKISGDAYQAMLSKNRRPQFTLAQMRQHHIAPTQKVSGNPKVTLVQLDKNESAKEYWLGFHNFYVITRYNTSNLYAMAVYQLSQALKKEMQS